MTGERILEHEPGDASAASLGYGKGGVPWLLMLLYAAFLFFFVWYTLEYQLPDYLEQGPITPGGAAESSSE